MKPRYRLFRRSRGIFFIEDCLTSKQESLRTKDKVEARRLFAAKNEAHEQPALNLQIARAYLMAIDAAIGTRTWQHAMDEVVRTKDGETQRRWVTATKDEAFDSLKSVVILETQAELFLDVLHAGTVSTNVYLRRLHNFALDMNWLPWPVIPNGSGRPCAFGRSGPSPCGSTSQSSRGKQTRSAGPFTSCAGIWAAPSLTLSRSRPRTSTGRAGLSGSHGRRQERCRWFTLARRLRRF